MNLWTVYDHPTDYPNSFVARRGIVSEGGEFKQTDDVIVSNSLDEIRTQLRGRGLAYLPRNPKDEPQIVEVWL
jgi:hypothetical protein